MPKICYQPKKFSSGVMAVITKANTILRDYTAQGYDLTLRQLYYKIYPSFPEDRKWTWVTERKKWVRDSAGSKNAEPNYKWLGTIINDARLAGLVDWSTITDRTRNMKKNSHWDSPQEIVATCADQFELDKWSTQSNYVEVWVEKDAMLGVLKKACEPLDVPYFSCRGYTSQSEMWSASQRLLEKIRAGKKVTIIHLGDHDPSGVDMSRDISDRLLDFLEYHLVRDHAKANIQRKGENDDAYIDRIQKEYVKGKYNASQKFELQRIALTMDQVQEYDLPPDPAKLTDSRSTKYIEEYGDESWELDALEPAVIDGLIESAVLELRDNDAWEAITQEEDTHKSIIKFAAENWRAVEDLHTNSNG